MSWLNPVAFVGLLALAVPILVHLFGRRVAKRQLFPSLRLLRDAKPTPATRSRPSDVLLLVLRCLTIAAAVAALAQPRWSGVGPERALARAILIDSSASMQRLTSEGVSALQEARAIAQRMADSSSEALVVETDRPGRSLAGAGSWLSRRGGMREVVVISDFQAGSIAEGDLAAVPLGIGARLVRLNGTGAIASFDTVGGVVIEAAPDRTNATWVSSGSDTVSSVRILAAEADRERVRASVAAVRGQTPISKESGSDPDFATLVFPNAPARPELLAQVVPFDSAWQGDLVLALARNPVLTSIAPSASVTQSCDAKGVVIARNRDGAAVASVARTASELLVFACVEPGTLAATALIAGVESALNPPPPMKELEPVFLPDETLRRLERPPVESSPRGREETSPDGRWIWLVALAFLLAEEFVRRQKPKRAAEGVNEVRNERVA